MYLRVYSNCKVYPNVLLRNYFWVDFESILNWSGMWILIYWALHKRYRSRCCFSSSIPMQFEPNTFHLSPTTCTLGSLPCKPQNFTYCKSYCLWDFPCFICWERCCGSSLGKPTHLSKNWALKYVAAIHLFIPSGYE